MHNLLKQMIKLTCWFSRISKLYLLLKTGLYEISVGHVRFLPGALWVIWGFFITSDQCNLQDHNVACKLTCSKRPIDVLSRRLPDVTISTSGWRWDMVMRRHDQNTTYFQRQYDVRCLLGELSVKRWRQSSVTHGVYEMEVEGLWLI